MKTNIRHILMTATAALTLTCVTSCIEETTPNDEATNESISASSESLEYLTNSLPTFLTTWCTYGETYYTQDWGYPCQMYMRDLLLNDFPMNDNNWNYWLYTENGESLRYAYYYPYYYYYTFIKNANNVIKVAQTSVEGGSKTAKNYLGQGYGYRAFLYLDLSRLYEYRRTGVETLDKEAEQSGVIGITVPIVKETTTKTELSNNPCAPFYTMYRFIMTDLNKAEECLSGYTRSNKAYMDKSVIYGLKARLWLEIATRFYKNADDLAKQVAAEGSDDGYDDLGISTTQQCYEKVIEYTRKAINSGYTPLTEAEWSDPTTGFNTANNSWMFGTLINSKEQINELPWYTFLGWMSSESSWGMTSSQYNAYRCIGKSLYDKISDKDWRKTSWVSPKDAGATTVPSAYKTNVTGEKWASMPAYANIKFRPGGGAIDDYQTALIASLPLMRIEEMYFDYIEALAHTQGVAAAASALQSWVNTYRYTDSSYKCTATDMDSFIEALMIQRRIELWGEGLVYFDYKRLGLAVVRHYTGSNYASNLQLNSYAGYVAPWMNYMIPEDERDRNPAVILAPNPSGAITVE